MSDPSRDNEVTRDCVAGDGLPAGGEGSVAGTASAGGGEVAGGGSRGLAAVHLVHVVKTGPDREVICPTLDEPVREMIRNIAAGWRDPRSIGRRLGELRNELGLGGMVVWLDYSAKYPAMPQPLEVPFEPLELDEARAPLADLCGTSSDPEEVARLRSSRLRRTWIRMGVPLAVFLPQVINGSLQMLLNGSLFIYLLWIGILSAVALMGVMTWWMSDQWFIVPRGVVVRRSLAGKLGRRVQLFTPQDTVVLVLQQVPYSMIQLWRNGRVQQRRSTMLELTALTAAFASPLAPPTLDQLSELDL